jgi:hypothetical protein
VSSGIGERSNGETPRDLVTELNVKAASPTYHGDLLKGKTGVITGPGLWRENENGIYKYLIRQSTGKQISDLSILRSLWP